MKQCVHIDAIGINMSIAVNIAQNIASSKATTLCPTERICQ